MAAVQKSLPIVAALMVLAGCAEAPRHPTPPHAPIAPLAWSDDSPAVQVEVLNRVTWGASRTGFAEIQ
jgi:hypothetical protein